MFLQCCFAEITAYYKNMPKQKEPRDARQEPVEVLANSYLRSESTTKRATAIGPEFVAVSNTSLKVMMILFAVCAALLMLIFVAAVISRCNFLHHSDNHDSAVRRCFLPFLGSVQRQKVEHQINVASVNDCSLTHSRTGTYYCSYYWRVIIPDPPD